MENTTFWSVTGEVAGIGPAVNFDGVEQPGKIDVQLRSTGGKLFTRTIPQPSPVPVVMGKRLTVTGTIEIFRSKKTNKDYERMTVLAVADPDAPQSAQVVGKK